MVGVTNAYPHIHCLVNWERNCRYFTVSVLLFDFHSLSNFFPQGPRGLPGERGRAGPNGAAVSYSLHFTEKVHFFKPGL